ncbi:MAG: SoxR reducing system RseC family protein [Deltaproteobacteria bacterium]|nr:SoxR reducing system RseC family protein [Deltaproteobacteria bacterium]
MATEQGLVIRIDSIGTWVKTGQSETCESCSSKGACHTLGGGKEVEVQVLNPIGAGIGDRIVLKMDSSRLLKATFLVYMFPILMLILGAGAGEWIARSAGLGSPASPILLGFGGLAAGLLIMRVLANRLAQKDEYRPRIVKILGKA